MISEQSLLYMRNLTNWIPAQVHEIYTEARAETRKVEAGMSCTDFDVSQGGTTRLESWSEAGVFDVF